MLIISASTIAFVALLNLERFLVLLGAGDVLLPLSAQYMEVTLWFMPFSMTTMLFIYFVRVSGYPGLAALAILPAELLVLLVAIAVYRANSPHTLIKHA